MGLLNLFSNRNKPLPDVFQYDRLPKELRAQIVHILQDTLSPHFGGGSWWAAIAKSIACEHGLLELPGHGDIHGRRDHQNDCLNYILLTPATERVLDMVELTFREMEAAENAYERVERTPEDAIHELNQRFRRHGVGYQYANGQIFRADSQLLHAEAVIPALQLLNAKGFKGPNDEFLAAHEHFRHGKYEEAVRGACNAFESTMNAICEKKKWKVDPKWAAGGLIKAMIDNKVVHEISREHLNALDKCLIGLATVGNNNGRHGAGATPRDVPVHLAAYALHLAASNIVFLVESFNAMK